MSTGVGERAFSVVVPHHARGAALARHRLVSTLAGGVDDDVLADIASIVSELVGNSVRHARPLPGGGVQVSWQLRDDIVEIRVTDGGSVDLPHVRRVGPEALGGRGLSIVAAIADRGGVVQDDEGQCVWAELRRVA